MRIKNTFKEWCELKSYIEESARTSKLENLLENNSNYSEKNEIPAMDGNNIF